MIPTASPATTRIGRGHHVGGDEKPRLSGKVVNNHSVAMLTTFKKP